MIASEICKKSTTTSTILRNPSWSYLKVPKDDLNNYQLSIQDYIKI